MSMLIEGVEPASLYEYNGSSLTAFTIFFVPFQIVFVGLRLYARRLVKAELSVDNVLCVISLISQIGMAGLAIGSVFHAGVGHHIEVLTIPTRIAFGKYLTAISIVYLAMTNVPKFAILCLYHRLFPQRPVRMAVYTIGIIMILQTISTLIADFAICMPFAANWNPMLLEPPVNGHCGDKEALYIWSSFPGIVTDLALLILPIPVILKLQMNMRVKAGVMATLLVGSFGLVTSCIRFSTFYQNNSFIDPTWTAVDLIIWTQVEAGVYLISACLPTLKPLIERASKSSLVTRTFKSSYAGNSGNGKKANRGYVPGRGAYALGGMSSDTDAYPLQNSADGPFERLDEESVSAEEKRKHAVSRSIVVTTEIDQTSKISQV